MVFVRRPSLPSSLSTCTRGGAAGHWAWLRWVSALRGGGQGVREWALSGPIAAAQAVTPPSPQAAGAVALLAASVARPPPPG